jgi:Zn-dependent protease
MLQSWRIFRLVGVDVRVHSLCLVSIAYVLWSAQPFTLLSLGQRAIDLVIITTAILVHELFHALAARECGICTTAITLLPFGGVAAFELPIERPSQRILVALVGPFSNIMLAIASASTLATLKLISFALIAPDSVILPWLAATEQMLLQAASINLAIAIFNLIPALPLDGGHILSGLAEIIAPQRQASVVGVFGGVIALALGAIGIRSADWLLCALALFMLVIGYQALRIPRTSS